MKKNSMKKISILSLTGLFSIFATIASAHHPMGGKTPTDFYEGMLSGIGHPIIGFDHLAFVVAVGIAAALAGSRFMAPLAFIAATLLGTVVHLASVSLPAVELTIALSLVVLGVAIFYGRKLPIVALAVIFAVAGLFHGFAYGEAIFGAETSPLLAYLLGFGLTQYAIAVVAGAAVVELLGKAQEWSKNIPARVAGGAVAGAGALLVSEHALAALNLAG